MSAPTLILYSTVDGHTRTICERLREVLVQRGHSVTLAELDTQPQELDRFDIVVVGASIRYGKHRPVVAQFMNRNAAVLKTKTSALFSVNVVARKAHKDAPATNPYMRKLLRQLTWRPALLAVFAGRIDYPKYAFWDRNIIRFIMWMTRGPTDARGVFEFTDWSRVEAFALEISQLGGR